MMLQAIDLFRQSDTFENLEQWFPKPSILVQVQVGPPHLFYNLAEHLFRDQLRPVLTSFAQFVGINWGYGKLGFSSPFILTSSSIAHIFTFLKSPVSTSLQPGGTVARLNIEDQFWLEVMSLAIKLGNQDLAIGNAVRWFRFAQEKHKSDQFVSEEEFVANGFSEHLFPTFASRTPAGIMAVGSEKHFGWLQKKRAAGHRGGLKSASQPRDAKGHFAEKEPEQVRAQPSKIKHSRPSSSSSSSSSISSSSSDSVSSSGGAVSKKSGEETNQVIRFYCDLWKTRYKSDRSPDVIGKDVGRLKSLVKDLGRDRVELLVHAYLSMPDRWFVTKRHDIPTLLGNLNAVSLFADSGQMVTQSELRQLDQQVTNQNTLDALRRGEV